jgi:hypothetical protein
MSDPVIFSSGFAQKTPLELTDRVIIGGAREYGTLSDVVALAISVLGETLGSGVQTVNSTSATITTARIVRLIDGAAGTITLTLPDAAAEREFVIVDARETEYGNNIVLARSAGDVTGSGKINGTASSYTIDRGYFSDVDGAIYHVEGLAALSWYVSSEWRALSEFKQAFDSFASSASSSFSDLDTRVVALEAYTVESGTNVTVTDQAEIYLTSTAATINVTLPDSAAGRRVSIWKANDATNQTINLIRSAADTATGTINDVVATRAISFSGLTSTRRFRSFTVRGTAAGKWVVDDGLMLDVADARTNITALTTRVTTLEAPTSVDKNAAAVSWTTEKRIRNIHAAALAVFTLDATVGDWPVGEGRPLANFSTAAFGIRVNVPSGHYLNGILNGTTGTKGAAAADDGNPIYTMLITREDTDRWSWA